MSVWSKGFWKGTVERVVASTAGAAVAALGSEMFNIVELDAMEVTGIALGAGLVSLLKALAATGLTGTASLVAAEVPSDSVVERVTPSETVVAGPANDMKHPGHPIRKIDHTPDGDLLAPQDRR